MSRTQPVWSQAELERDANIASETFRAERLGVSGDWTKQYLAARSKFESLFGALDDLDPGTISTDNLAKVYSLGLGEALRYLAGPPISDDDLKVIADVESMSPGVLQKNPAALRKFHDVIARILDPHRFPWVTSSRSPSATEREAALVASSVLLAAQRLATERRNDGKDAQEEGVKAYLRKCGFVEVETGPIKTIVHGPRENQFCGESLLGERKADVVVRLRDTRLLAIECKVSNSATNSVKRLNNDAAVKADYWLKQFGTSQVVPAAVLGGVYNVLNLEQAQARGLALFWAHDLEKLGAFISQH
jgi:hypothetical protein